MHAAGGELPDAFERVRIRVETCQRELAEVVANVVGGQPSHLKGVDAREPEPDDLGHALALLVRELWLAQLPQPVHGCSEAGPTGYALYRACEAAGLHVDVVAPSKTPRAPGDRVKTDRKDAELLVRLLLAGSLTAVAVPTATIEAARDLARAREQARADLARVRHRVSKLLLRHGRVYERGGTWTQAHRQWLAGQRFAHAATELAFLD